MATRIVTLVLALALILPLSMATLDANARKKPKEVKTIIRTFSSDEPITFPIITANDGPADVYPAQIDVGGLKKGKIVDVNLILSDFGHESPDDVDMLLVAPNGDTALVMSDVGGSSGYFSLPITLDDEAAEPMPDSEILYYGTFQPTNWLGFDGDDPFSSPAPSHNGNASLSVFDGDNPNGTWRLFIDDDTSDGSVDPIPEGRLDEGWALEITAKVKTRKKRR